jgi:tetratricopeptide (TPR) repeat protein
VRGQRWAVSPRAERWPMMRTRQTGASASLLAAYAAALSLSTPSLSKTPGEVHCYNGICHRVKAVEEMQFLVGTQTEALTSYYDIPERDRMNVGTITSSGEEFDADSDQHAASSLYPDGTELLVWNPKNQRAAHIRVNDFGPFYMLRTIDVTRGVAEKLEFHKTGVAKLRVIVLWAPSREEARFRRHRVYPAVEGYLGRMDADQLTALTHRLIATAPARNGREPVIASLAPRHSLAMLPAFASKEASSDRIKRKAIVLNTPQGQLAVHMPDIGLLTSRAIAAAPPTAHPLLVHSTSAKAMAAASSPAASIITARDLEVSAVVASLAEPAPAPHATVRVAEVNRLQRDVTSSLSAFDSPILRTSMPNALLWQQLLVALGVLSIAAVSWRSRPISQAAPRMVSRRVEPIAPETDHLVPELHLVSGGSTAAHETSSYQPSAVEPIVSYPLADNVIVLPQLPQRPNAKSMDEWRDDAIADMERYAYSSAEHAYRQLLAAREFAMGHGDPMTASAERQLADCLREQGRYTAAEPHYRRAVATMASAVGEMHPATADTLDEYSVSLLRQGYGARAETIARQSLAIRRASSQRGREYAVTLSIIAEALRVQGQLAAAETEHRNSWALLIAACGQDSGDAAVSMLRLGAVLGELGRFAAAEELLNAAAKTLSALCGAEHPVVALGYALLGDLYQRAGAVDASIAMHGHALALRQHSLGMRHPDTVESQLTLASLATLQYRMDDARALLDSALDALIGSERNHLGPQSRIRSLIVGLSHQHDTSPPVALAAE